MIRIAAAPRALVATVFVAVGLSTFVVAMPANAQSYTCSNFKSTGWRDGFTGNQTFSYGSSAYLYVSRDQVCDSDTSPSRNYTPHKSRRLTLIIASRLPELFEGTTSAPTPLPIAGT